MRSLKVMLKAFVDVYDSMFPLLLINIVWIVLAALPVSYIISVLYSAQELPEGVFGAPVVLFILFLLLALLTSPASYALAVLMRRASDYESISVRDFFVELRRNARRGWVLGLVVVLGTSLLAINLIFYATLGGWATALVPLFALLSLFWLLILLYLFPMAVITDGGILRVLRNCIIVVVRHPGLSLLAGLVALLIIVLSSVLVVPWVILTMGVITTIGTRAVRSAVRRDFGQPEEEPLTNEPLPPISAGDGDDGSRASLPHYGWRAGRREADDEESAGHADNEDEDEDEAEDETEAEAPAGRPTAGTAPDVAPSAPPAASTGD